MKKSLITLVKIFSYIGILIFSLILIQELIKVNSDDKTVRSLFRIVHEGLFFVVALILFLIYTKYWDKIDIKKSVLFPGNYAKNIIQGLVLGTVLILVTYFITKSLGFIKIEATEIASNQKLIIIIALAVSMIFTAFWEELAFRGYALNNLQKIIGKHGAAITVALIFGLLHLLSPLKSGFIVVSTFCSGLLLNYAFFSKRNLYFPIGIHYAWNTINAILYTGYIFKVEYVNTLWGGIKNPEQGIIGITFTFLGFLFVFLYYKQYKAS